MWTGSWLRCIMLFRADALRRILSDLFGLESVALFGRGRAGLAALLEELGASGLPVLIPSNLCPAVLAAVVAAGASPILVPVSPQTGLADDERFAAVLRAQPALRGFVMPTHLYGFWTDYRQTARLARARGWFVIENDCMATLAASEKPKPAIGDAVLVSFGSGKTIDAGGGGAIFTRDEGLAAALDRRAGAWPNLGFDDEATERHLTEARRSLRALGHPALAELLLSQDLSHLRHRFDERLAEPLTAALSGFRKDCQRRRDRLESWRDSLAGLSDALTIPTVEAAAPWRMICRTRSADLRERVAQDLRRAGFDAGINYPPLTDGFPALLSGQRHVDAEDWGGNVLNLWLTDDYDPNRISRAAAVIAGSLGIAA